MTDTITIGKPMDEGMRLLLTKLLEEGRIRDGDLVCLTAFGSGFTWGAALIRW